MRYSYQEIRFVRLSFSFFLEIEVFLCINLLGYVYQFKDHLGNIRLSYKDANKDGAITQSEIIPNGTDLQSVKHTKIQKQSYHK